jgi:hypothetical protein
MRLQLFPTTRREQLMGILKTARFLMIVYFALGLTFAGIAWGEASKYRNCPVIDHIFILSAESHPAEGIAVTALFWPAVVIAAFIATCRS